jgi:hypothetical protein
MWGALSDERTDLSLQLLLALDSAVIFGSESHGTLDSTRILLSQVRDFPFRRLLLLARLRWRYSTPPPQGIWMNQSQSESELFYDWRFIANQFVLAPNPLRLTARIFLSQWNTCGNSPCITFSMTRGWVCHLKLLLALASAFILGSYSRGTRDHILRSQIRDFPFCRLLRLAGLRWRYSTPPPHGEDRI